MDKTLWDATSKIRKRYQSIEGQVTTDVVIIGAGFTGIAASYYLQEKNVSTVVLEQHTVGWGATGRNGGMMNTGYKLSAAKMIEKFGAEEAKRLDQYALDSIREVVKLSEQHNIDCSVRKSGHIALSPSIKKADHFKSNQELIAKHFNREVKVLQGSELQNEISTTYYKSGFYDPESHSFQPLDYVTGLAEVTASLGATIYENSRATRVKKTHDGYIVLTENGQVKAKDVVYATDGYSGTIVKELKKGVFPISSYIIATEKLSEEKFESIIPNNRMLYDLINLTNYFRKTPDGRIILGGSGIDYPAKDKHYRELYQKLIQIYPQLKGIKIDYKWGGLIGATIDKLPIIGRTENGEYYSVGYTGHGAAQSTLHGKLLAQCILNEERLNSTFEKLPLKTIPLYNNKEFLAKSANVFFRLLDKLNM